MIPSDIASALRLQLSEQAKLSAEQAKNQPVVTAQRITDALSDLQPGQRIMAEIQALLPDGSYRAVVGQREVTLALPFSAKAGDSLELEVVDNDGQLTFAIATNLPQNELAGRQTASTNTSLSQTGKLIGDLIGNVDDPNQRASPAPLNSNIPLAEDFPVRGADLAIVLREALTKSGVFYEAHQARWVAGELSTDTLRQEPQGKFPAVAAETMYQPRPEAVLQGTRPLVVAQDSSPIPQEIRLIVQQQLDALATQNYAWQGQIWPGQQMQWEISENPKRKLQEQVDSISHWQTRIRLTLPSLGSIDAVLRLQQNCDVEIFLTATSSASETILRKRISDLSNQFETNGLRLVQANFSDAPPLDE
ncbi:flagellar hook-length control protein FliK [Azonexus sp. IMCC34839]|uniref:flagellar hook-length control protein FliK n=1 Tax=Azonexus sp. IMCC34839 TaxID=3133695 RepID=UPI00399BE42F